MPLKKPTCFISYSWEGKRHQRWVSRLAQALVLNGVNVHVDFWETHLGMNISHYMESSVKKSSHVLIVCTPVYAARADDRKGGVGAETSLVTGQMVTAKNKKKFVPILRQGEPGKALPTYLKGTIYVDFRGRAFREPLEDLLRHIFDEREMKPPEMGERPTFPRVVLPKGVSAIKRAAQPKKRVVRKKQKQLQRFMTGDDPGLSRETISRAARDLPELPRPEFPSTAAKRKAAKKKKRPKK